MKSKNKNKLKCVPCLQEFHSHTWYTIFILDNVSKLKGKVLPIDRRGNTTKYWSIDFILLSSIYLPFWLNLIAINCEHTVQLNVWNITMRLFRITMNYLFRVHIYNSSMTIIWANNGKFHYKDCNRNVNMEHHCHESTICKVNEK